jgi:glycosyltransferase involved in cell wall biosynthesis
MRIAVIGSRGVPASYGGIERHVEELYARLAERGVDADIFCRRKYIAPNQGKVEWEKNLRQGRYRGMRLIVMGAPKSKGLEAFVHSFAATIRALFGGYDLIHFHAIGPSFFSFLPRLLGKKAVVTVHALDWQRPKWRGMSRRFLRYCERRLGRGRVPLICVSKDLRAHFESEYGKRTEYIPNGAAIPKRLESDSLPEWGLEAGQYIVFFGRLTAEKGVADLIQAFGLVETDVKLAIVGGDAGDGAYMARLKKMAGERAVFTGYQYGDALNRLVANSRFAVNPSHLEGMPIVALESFALGKHVLASDIPPHREAIKDPDWIFPAGDIESLATKLKDRLGLELPPSSQSLIGLVRREYAWERIAENTLSFLKRAAAD